METITDLIKGVSVPRMVKIREVFDDTHIPVNMIADINGFPKKRFGWKTIKTFEGRINNYMWQPRDE